MAFGAFKQVLEADSRLLSARGYHQLSRQGAELRIYVLDVAGLDNEPYYHILTRL